MSGVFELLAFGTEKPDDIRWRTYTRSQATAEAFAKIPRIDFTNSGHGIVFRAVRLGKGVKRRPTVRIVADHVREHLGKLPT